MLLTKILRIHAYGRNKKKYSEKGYDVSEEYIDVAIEDVDKGCNLFIEYQCDYCGNVFRKQYNSYNKKRETLNKDCCPNCFLLKYKESLHNKYGVDNSRHIEGNEEKRKRTIKERYGVDSIQKVPEIVEKKRNTFQSHYGTDWGLQSSEVRGKIHKTNQERYGVDNPFENEDIRKKAAENAYHKYGKKLYAKMTSSQQLHFADIFGGELNYKIGKYYVDILFLQENIYFEYDGRAHNLCVRLGKVTQEKFEERESIRSDFLMSNGLKEFRIKSSTDKLPNDEELLKVKDLAFSYLLNKSNTSFIYNLDNNSYTYK